MYKGGELDGVWAEHFTNGQLKLEHRCEAGIPHGQWTEWHANGQRSLEFVVNGEGQPVGLWRSWHEIGQVVSEIDHGDG